MFLRQVDPGHDLDVFARHVRALSGPLTILEAGCGRRWALELEGVDYRLVGVDINAASMKLRQSVVGDLDEAIVGDLRTVPLEAGRYDVVFCSFVLEHVEDAELVLSRLVSALKPAGLLLLRIPDRDAVYGWLARHTPHRSHVWYKRVIRGSKHAGSPGHGPFPVVYDSIVSWRELQEYCAEHGLTIVDAMSTNGHLAFFPRGVRQLINLGFHAIATTSRGRLTADHANLALVIRR